MFDHGRKLTMQVGRKPEGGLQVLQQGREGRRPETILLHLVAKEWLLAQEPLLVAMLVDAQRPIVGQEHVHAC